MAPSYIHHLSFPYDVVHYIADILLDGPEPHFIHLKHLLNYALVDRTFAIVFQPRIFHTTVVGDSARLALMLCPPRLPKLLSILSSNPGLANHIKHLTLVMHNPGNNALLPRLLDRLTAVRSLIIKSRGPSEIDGIRPFWASFTEGYRSSVMRLCGLSTLNNLEIAEIDSVPASLFLGNAHLTNITFSKCDPIFDSGFLSPHSRHASAPSPLSLSVPSMTFRGRKPGAMVHHCIAFFSRISRLEITTGWKRAKRDLFDSLINSLADVSQIDQLDVVVDPKGVDDGPLAPTANWLLPICSLTSLRALCFTHVAEKGPFQQLAHIVKSVQILLSAPNTPRLELLVMSFTRLDDSSLRDVCQDQPYVREMWQPLQAVLTEKISDGGLPRFSELRICLEIDRTEWHPDLAFARKTVTETKILSQLPVGVRRRVVLKSKLGFVKNLWAQPNPVFRPIEVSINTLLVRSPSYSTPATDADPDHEPGHGSPKVILDSGARAEAAFKMGNASYHDPDAHGDFVARDKSRSKIGRKARKVIPDSGARAEAAFKKMGNAFYRDSETHNESSSDYSDEGTVEEQVQSAALSPRTVSRKPAKERIVIDLTVDSESEPDARKVARVMEKSVSQTANANDDALPSTITLLPGNSQSNSSRKRIPCQGNKPLAPGRDYAATVSLLIKIIVRVTVVVVGVGLASALVELFA
ncbi:hypothetical protein FA13DRAFT_1717852 [Coprinellus micaceus]|uniref:Uncharacterized protein n=1 Tax=Coprinellus micaceus TaxID=71717 RepID=A0A4Y7SF55_COPMI|nr:hypothetical protein FA13DRAFT_1717852 [Coprinellus micaceus]